MRVALDIGVSDFRIVNISYMPSYFQALGKASQMKRKVWVPAKVKVDETYPQIPKLMDEITIEKLEGGII